MNSQKFKTYMAAARAMSGDYAAGYQRGLRRCYHGENFGTTDSNLTHDQWMAMDGHRQELGDGYRDGFAGRPPRRTHGNTGNQNASKGHDTHLNIRVPAESKAGWVKVAQSVPGRTLTEWVIEALDRAAE